MSAPEQLSLVDEALLTRDRLRQFFEANHQQYIESLRAFAIARCRYVGTITTDDLREVLAEKKYPLPHEVGIDDRILGVTLRHCKDLRCVGSTMSRRPERIARSGKNASSICIYELRHAEKGAA